MDRDVSGATFDEVMGLLRAAPDELMLEVGGRRAAGWASPRQSRCRGRELRSKQELHPS